MDRKPLSYTGSFPFLALAKHYGVRYGDVLLVAESLHNEDQTPLSPGRHAVRMAGIERIYAQLPEVDIFSLAKAIGSAHYDMKRIQAGET